MTRNSDLGMDVAAANKKAFKSKKHIPYKLEDEE